jgi:uncharacterized protein (UPF0261 family)
MKFLAKCLRFQPMLPLVLSAVMVSTSEGGVDTYIDGEDYIVYVSHTHYLCHTDICDRELDNKLCWICVC